MTVTTAQWETVWERARAGAHTIIIGEELAPLAPGDLQMLWVGCDAGGSARDPLSEALQRIEHLLGEDTSPPAQVRASQGAGLPERLFDDLPAPSIETRFVDACNRLAAWTGCNVVVGFEALDASDEATITMLMQILRHPGWLRLPVILTVRRVTQGAISELIDVQRHAAGDAAVIELYSRAQPTTPTATFNWTMLPSDVLRVLRAGSVIGSEFQAELIARMLDEPLGSILEKLQQATDAGVALVDRGEGRFALPPEAHQTLQADMLPSLLAFRHAQIGAFLSEEPPHSHKILQPEFQSEILLREPAAISQVGVETDDEKTPLLDAPKEASQHPPSERSLAADYADLFESELTPEAPSHVSLALEDAVDEAVTPNVARTKDKWDERGWAQPETNQGRAAEHLQAAGQIEAAVAQYLAAMQQAADRGDARRAAIMAQQALALLDRLPPSAPRAQLRAHLLLVLGNIQWRSAALGAHFTLKDALASFNAAKTSLPEMAPLEVVGQLAAVTAGVCYDLGALDDLQHALVELSTVSRQLLEAGKPMQAACLLNDQAAIYVRLGHPVRAAHLLKRSRALFDALLQSTPDDVTAARELAATDHLLARLPLHTSIRPGRETAAYAISLDRALAAENVYERLEQPRELARVWETIGRLELGRGRLDAARGRFLRALELQKRIGDVTGLARTTGALAEMSMAENQLSEAATLLANSIALNFEKGSPIGLAFNRRAFDALQQAANRIKTPASANLPGILEDVERRLAQAERVLGRLTLPGDRREQHGAY